MPDTKVGTKFKRGTNNLVKAAEDVRKAVSSSGKDIVVILDDSLKSGSEGAKSNIEKTAEVLKAAGSVTHFKLLE